MLTVSKPLTTQKLVFLVLLCFSACGAKTFQELGDCERLAVPTCETNCSSLIPVNLTKTHQCYMKLMLTELAEFVGCFNQSIDLRNTECSVPADFTLASKLFGIHHPKHNRNQFRSRSRSNEEGPPPDWRQMRSNSNSNSNSSSKSREFYGLHGFERPSGTNGSTWPRGPMGPGRHRGEFMGAGPGWSHGKQANFGGPHGPSPPPFALKEYHDCMATCFKAANCEEGCAEVPDQAVLEVFATCHRRPDQQDFEAMRKCFEVTE